MTDWSDEQQCMAAEAADAVVERAIKYTIGEGNPLPDDCLSAVIAQHVKVQLAFLTTPGGEDLDFPKRNMLALESLARAHAQDGVRVNMTQS